MSVIALTLQGGGEVCRPVKKHWDAEAFKTEEDWGSTDASTPDKRVKNSFENGDFVKQRLFKGRSRTDRGKWVDFCLIFFF